MSSVWITRTEPGASRSAEAWREAGFTAFVSPLLSVRPVVPEALLPSTFIPAFTSPNAVRLSGLDPSGPALVVGDATGMEATKAGWAAVRMGGGDVKSMAQAIVAKFADPKEGSQGADLLEHIIVHICGRRLAGDLVEGLRMAGLSAQRHVVYDTVAVEALPHFPCPPSVTALMSPYAAETFERLAPTGWPGAVACLSEAVAKRLSGRRVVVAEQPTQAALIAAARKEVEA